MNLSIGRAILRCLPLVLVCGLGVPAEARPKTDSVVLLNGDRITGEIKSMENGVLRYGTDSMGTVSIEWDGVTALNSNYFFRVRTIAGERYFGAIGPSETHGYVQVLHAEGTEDYPVMDIVAIVPIETTLSERLDTMVRAGYSDFKASDSSTTELGLTITYDDALSTNRLTARSVVTDNSGETNTSNLVRASRAKLWQNPRYFNYYTSSWESNDELAVDSRLTLGYGIGRHLFDNNRTKLSFVVGLQGLTEEDSLGETEESLEGLLAVNYRTWRFTSPELDLVTVLRVYPGLTETGRVRGDGEITLSWEVMSDLNLTLSGFGSFDNETNEDGDDYDYGITTGIEYEF